MAKYTYKVTGEYKDWLEMKKGNTLIHNGSLIGLLAYTHDKLEIKLNYGTETYYISELKKAGDMFITVPLEMDNLNATYTFMPLVLSNEEYCELIDISYIDRSLLANIQNATESDIHKILLSNFKREFGDVANNLDFKALVDNIIAYSEYDDEIANKFKQVANDKEVVVTEIQEDKQENIVVYIDIEGKVYEWNLIVYSNKAFYLRVLEDYFIQI